MNRIALAVVAAAALISAANAQAIPVPLNYNFNGILHAGEAALPDSLTGFRSISDRGLDFTNGVPADPLLANYQFVTTADTLDIVHLGNRDTVDNGNWAFDLVADGDFIGVIPGWLASADQTGPQTSTLVAPMPVAPSTQAAFLYQISNGGGAFDVTFTFLGGATFTATLTGGDWFGGTLPGVQDVDLGSIGNNLSVTEGRVSLAAFAGQVVTDITFSNRSNPNAGYAILACNFEYQPQSPRINQIALNYNWNGIVHAGEAGQPDNPNGYRSISDRGLDFSAGVPALALLTPYSLVGAANTLDVVHLGNRNTVAGGGWAFDLVADGDNVGIQPAWLANPAQNTPQTTTLTDAIVLDANSEAKLLFQISNGGGSFDVEFAFQTGAPVVTTVSGGDWFGGAFLGTDNADFGTPGNNLSITERTINLSAHAGRVLTAISFQNSSNPNAGIAILAMNVGGCIFCNNGVAASIVNLGGGTSGQMSTTSTGGLGAPLNYTLTFAAPNNPGVWAFGLSNVSVPLALVVPGCLGTIVSSTDLLLGAFTDPFGGASIDVPVPNDQALCGAAITTQFAALAPGACWLVLSDGLKISVGN